MWEATKEEVIVREFEADETVCLLLEKLQFYETRLSLGDMVEVEEATRLTSCDFIMYNNRCLGNLNTIFKVWTLLY